MPRTSYAEAVVVLARFASASPNGLAQPPATPDAAARLWLSFVDGGNYIKSWDHAGGLFKNAINTQDWKARIAYVREPLGAVTYRRLIDLKFSNTMAGLPEGKYACVKFNSSFANKVAETEIVGLTKEDDHWAVIGYLIN